MKDNRIPKKALNLKWKGKLPRSRARKCRKQEVKRNIKAKKKMEISNEEGFKVKD